MKIAFVSDRTAPFYLGGYEERLRRFATRLAARGHEVDVYTSCEREARIDDVRYIPVSDPVAYFKPSGFRNLGDNLAFACKLGRVALTKRRYDIVDANATPWLHLPTAALLAKRWDAALVISAHEALGGAMAGYFAAKQAPFSKLQGRLARRIYGGTQSLADVIVATSPSCVESLRSEGYRCPVVATQIGQDRVGFEELDLDRPPLRLMFVGRHVQNKHLDVILRAVAGLPDVALNVIGDGPLFEEHRKLSGELGCNATFYGRVDEAKKHDLMLSTDAIAIASPREGYCIAAAEGMAHGAFPIFAYRPDKFETGVATYASDGVNAVAFDGTATHLRDTIVALRDDPARVARLRRSAWSKAADFDWPSCISELERAYHLARTLHHERRASQAVQLNVPERE